MENTSSKHVILTPEEAATRVKKWEILWNSGAALIWHPATVDTVLNSPQTGEFTITGLAAIGAGKGTAEALLAYLKSSMEEAPFRFGFLRLFAYRNAPTSITGSHNLAEKSLEVLWDTACQYAGSFQPIGTCTTGARPYYYCHYLRLHLLGSLKKIHTLVGEHWASCDEDILDRAPLDDCNVQHAVNTASRVCENETVRILRNAVIAVQEHPRLARVWDLLVVRGLTLREAATDVGVGKSSLQRDAETLIAVIKAEFQKRDTPVLGNKNTDTWRAIKALQDLVQLDEGFLLPPSQSTTCQPSESAPMRHPFFPCC